MNGSPGNADVPVGYGQEVAGNADVPVGYGQEVVGEDAGAPEDVGAPREWYSRGYLPHRDRVGLIQSVTFRLADSLPQSKLKRLEEELESLEPSRVDVERRKKIEAWLDAGMGSCALRHPEVGDYIVESLMHFHDERYYLHAWCIMPNHVHVLVEPFIDLATIVQGWKSFTSRWVLMQNDRLQLGIPNPRCLWMREYWDRFIRDENHYRKALDYIHNNPVIAGLCLKPEDWRWSSAHPGNADVPVGATLTNADGDVGAPRKP